MATLVVASPTPGAGKTMIAAALGRRLAGTGGQITEAPTGQLTVVGEPDARIIVVSRPTVSPDDLTKFIAGSTNARVLLNRVPARRIAPIRESYEAAGLSVIGVVPEDALLASPTIGQLRDALSAEAENIDGNREKPLQRIVIASIAADPGQTYFDFTRADAIIVRSDKPDLQLAALNALTSSVLILTGDLPVLSYVLERVEENEIPLLRTKLDTRETVAAIEDLFGTGAFSASPEKQRRIDELLADVDLDSLLASSAAS
jgi:BioD-like phosphotransacetylase family protein